MLLPALVENYKTILLHPSPTHALTIQIFPNPFPHANHPLYFDLKVAHRLHLPSLLNPPILPPPPTPSAPASSAFPSFQLSYLPLLPLGLLLPSPTEPPHPPDHPFWTLTNTMYLKFVLKRHGDNKGHRNFLRET